MKESCVGCGELSAKLPPYYGHDPRCLFVKAWRVDHYLVGKRWFRR